MIQSVKVFIARQAIGDMRLSRAVLAVCSVIILVLVIILFYKSGLTGKIVQWETQQLNQGTDFSRGLPKLNPETLPNNKTLDSSGAYNVACENAKKERKDACERFVERYSRGCRWWQVPLISRCQELRDLCNEKQAVVEKACVQ